jgi:hypothetical protein
MTTLQASGNIAYGQSIQINGPVHGNVNLPAIINLPIAKGASFDSHIEKHNSRCHPNTRIELLHHIQEWAKDRNGKPIFLAERYGWHRKVYDCRDCCPAV